MITVDVHKTVPYLKRMMYFIPKKPVIPIYSCFKVTVNKNSMDLFAFDGGKSIQVTVKCESDISASYAVPAKLLTDTLGLINEPEVGFDFIKNHIVIKSGRKNISKISVYDGREYPVLRKCEKNNEISYSCESFKKDMLCMVDFADQKSNKEVFHGIHMKMSNGNILFEAANDFIIGQIKTEPRSITRWANILVPAEMIKTVADSLDDRDIIKVFHDGKQILFSTSDYEISSTVIDKKYPDVDAVFNKFSKGRHIKFDSYHAEIAFKKIKMYANANIPYEATMTFKGNELEIKAKDTFLNNEAEEFIDLSANEGVDCGVTVRADQLLGVIQAIGEGEILMFVESPEHPIYGRKESSDDRRFMISAIKTN